MSHLCSHRPRHRLALLTLVIVAGLTIGSAGNAAAQRWTSADPAGDVDGVLYDPDPAPCGTITHVDASAATDVDLTGLSVRHQRSDVTVEIGVADLPAAGAESMTVHLRTPQRAWALDLNRTGPTGFSAFLYEEPDWAALIEQADPDGDGCWSVGVVLTEESCAGLAHRGDPERDVVRLSIPRSCLGMPHWVRVAAESAAWRDTDNAMFHDRWAPEGVEATSFVGPFGPRVHAGPVVATAAPARDRVSSGSRTVHRQITLTATEAGITAVTAAVADR